MLCLWEAWEFGHVIGTAGGKNHPLKDLKCLSSSVISNFPACRFYETQVVVLCVHVPLGLGLAKFIMASLGVLLQLS